VKKSTDQFCAYLDVLSETLKYAETSRVLGLHPSTIFHWLKASKAAAAHPEQQSEFYFDYAGQPGWLHEHVRGVITVSIEEIESAARSRALHGHTSIARFQGRTVYQRDPELIGRPELVEFLGLPDDLLRDPVTGHPVPEIIVHAPSTDLVAMVLQAHSKIYRKQSSVSVDLNARVSGGVMVIGGQQKPQAQLPLPVLEIINAAEEDSTPTPTAEPFEDADAADGFSTDELEDDEPDDIAPAPAPAPRPPTTTARPPTTTTKPTPAPAGPGPNPAVRRGDNEMMRDLLARLSAKQGSPERVAPVARVSPRDSDDYDANRCGPGEPPTGTRVA
jgi:hypothetical protein